MKIKKKIVYLHFFAAVLPLVFGLVLAPFRTLVRVGAFVPLLQTKEKYFGLGSSIFPGIVHKRYPATRILCHLYPSKYPESLKI